MFNRLSVMLLTLIACVSVSNSYANTNSADLKYLIYCSKPCLKTLPASEYEVLMQHPEKAEKPAGSYLFVGTKVAAMLLRRQPRDMEIVFVAPPQDQLAKRDLIKRSKQAVGETLRNHIRQDASNRPDYRQITSTNVIGAWMQDTTAKNVETAILLAHDVTLPNAQRQHTRHIYNGLLDYYVRKEQTRMGDFSLFEKRQTAWFQRAREELSQLRVELQANKVGTNERRWLENTYQAFTAGYSKWMKSDKKYAWFYRTPGGGLSDGYYSAYLYFQLFINHLQQQKQQKKQADTVLQAYIDEMRLIANQLREKLIDHVATTGRFHRKPTPRRSYEQLIQAEQHWHQASEVYIPIKRHTLFVKHQDKRRKDLLTFNASK